MHLYRYDTGVRFVPLPPLFRPHDFHRSQKRNTLWNFRNTFKNVSTFIILTPCALAKLHDPSRQRETSILRDPNIFTMCGKLTWAAPISNSSPSIFSPQHLCWGSPFLPWVCLFDEAVLVGPPAAPETLLLLSFVSGAWTWDLPFTRLTPCHWAICSWLDCIFIDF